MALTRDFRETIQARAAQDRGFRAALFTEALDSYLAGDVALGKAMLRDLVNATIGFERLAVEVKKPSKSLHRMLAPRGNPSSQNLFEIVAALQRATGVKLSVSATISAPKKGRGLPQPFAAKRDIGQEIIAGIVEIKRGHKGRVTEVHAAGHIARHAKRVSRERSRAK